MRCPRLQPYGFVLKMLEDCARGSTVRMANHSRVIEYNGKVYRKFPSTRTWSCPEVDSHPGDRPGLRCKVHSELLARVNKVGQRPHVHRSDCPRRRDLAAPCIVLTRRAFLCETNSNRPNLEIEQVSKSASAGMIVVFALGMVYATNCAVTCALEVCIRPVAAHTPSHHDHESSGHSGGHSGTPSEPGSHEPDCNTHGHPGSFVKAHAAPQTTVAIDRLAQISSPFDIMASSTVPHLSLPLGRAHAPPPGSKEPLYQKISVLRV